MEFKDYYATLGVSKTAATADVKRAYRKLARKYHPDVSKEPNAEARFKDVAEAHEALIDPERRAAYDDIAQRHASGQPFEPPPGWGGGFEFSGKGSPGPAQRSHFRRSTSGHGPAGAAAEERDFSEFFESLFGRGAPEDLRAAGVRRPPGAARAMPGQDHHARLAVDLLQAYAGGSRTLSLRRPVQDAAGKLTLQDHALEVQIPKGVRDGQRLRLAGQGAPGHGGAAAGDLYLQIEMQPHPLFRLDGSDVAFDLPIAPWEAALGAEVTAPTPEGPVQLNVPAGSVAGRKLRLRGRGLPGKVPGDLYAVLTLALPPALTDVDQAAYRAFAAAFPAFAPRAALPV